MRNFEWDSFETSEFFLHEASPIDFEDEQGTHFTATDGTLDARVIVLPVRGVVCFSLLSSTDRRLITDLSILPMTRLDRRLVNGHDSLYCHECVVAPGFHAYQKLEWYSFYSYLEISCKPVSILFQIQPNISLRIFDPAEANRTI
jgi:hypothetical protein